MDDAAVRERVVRVEEALEALERLPDAPRETALQAVGSLVELYGEGWARALARLAELCPGGAESLAEDELVGHLLMIHGLHPRTVEDRVRLALDEVASTVNADGTEMELVGVSDGVARVRFRSDGVAPAPGLAELVEKAILQTAPELERVEVERPTPQARKSRPGLVQLQLGRPGRPTSESREKEAR